jgi:hypothetical protein
MTSRGELAMKLLVRPLTLSVFGALTGLYVGCAHVPPPVDDTKEAKKALPQAVLVTGSHIPQRVDPTTGLPTTTSPVRIYSRNQIDSTGRQTDLAAALRTLDSSITP